MKQIFLAIFLLFFQIITHAQTRLIKDIKRGTASSYPTNLTNINGTLFFTATDLTSGTELYKAMEKPQEQLE